MTNNAAAIVDAMHAAFRRGDLETIAAYWAEDVDYEAPGVTLKGKAARRVAETVWLNAFSANDVRVLHRLADGDTLTDFCLMEGTHSGPLALPDGSALAPTGRRISGAYAARYRIADGKVQHQQVIYDRLALMQMLTA